MQARADGRFMVLQRVSMYYRLWIADVTPLRGINENDISERIEHSSPTVVHLSIAIMHDARLSGNPEWRSVADCRGSPKYTE